MHILPFPLAIFMLFVNAELLCPAEAVAEQASAAEGQPGAGLQIQIQWHGHAAFRIVDGGKQIYVDPYRLPDGLPQADYIFITHGHGDHFSPDDIAKVRGDATKIVAPADVAKKIGKGVFAVKPGQKGKLGGLHVAMVPAYNVNKFRKPGVPFHPKDNGWVGYVITLSDGTVVYHAGDTDFVPEMKTLKADVALLPVSGKFVMTAEEAIDAANAFKPKLVIPMHYGTIVGSEADAKRFQEGYQSATKILGKGLAFEIGPQPKAAPR
jgi:L-ascorbate metabolism protein UlaG (beta-lactamase superfamily)